MATRDEWAACAAAGMTATTVTLPWPARLLHPNARVHWAALANVRKRARADGWALAMAHTTSTQRAILKAAGAVSVLVTFHAPDNRRRDDDGLIASLKSHRDGIADAIGVDDGNWRVSYARGEPVKDGAVIVEIQPAQERPRDLPASDDELRLRMAEQVEALRGRGFEAVGDVVKRVVASVPK